MRSRIVTILSVTLMITSMIIITTANALSDGTVASEQKISSTAGGFGTGLDNGDDFGRSVANIGDLDDDGVTDLAVGAPGDDDGSGQAGAVWILFMNSDGTVASKAKISGTTGGFGGSPGGNDNFGDSVVGLGDLDGDGVEDIAVGEQRDDDGGADRGAMWILFLNTDGTVNAEQKISQTAGGFGGTLINSGNFGFSAANIGDLDNDGVTDLAVGAFQGDAGGKGEVWILFLNTDGTVSSEQRITDGVGGFSGSLAAGDFFGSGVAGLGDLDGDGIEDIAASAQGDDDGGSNRGAAWILFLNADGTVASDQKISDTAGGFTESAR